MKTLQQIREEVRHRGGGSYEIHHDGKHIGNASVASDGNKDFLSSVELNKEHQGKGLGKQAYDAIEKHRGKKLHPSPLGLSDNATKMWKKRVANNAPQEKRQMVKGMYKSGRSYKVPWKDIRSRVKGVFKG